MGDGSVAAIDLAAKKTAAVWPVGVAGTGGATSHPTEMVLSPERKAALRRLLERHSQYVQSIRTTATGRPLEQILQRSLSKRSPTGSTPNSLALLSSDGKVLLIANADNNNIAMIDVILVRQESFARLYPGRLVSDVRSLSSSGDKQILVANGKGKIEPKANPDGPDPLVPKEEGRRSSISPAPLQAHLSVIDATFARRIR